jgi:hypothetical protein
MARRLADEKDAAATERGLIFSHRLWINFPVERKKPNVRLAVHSLVHSFSLRFGGHVFSSYKLQLAIRKRNRLNV